MAKKVRSYVVRIVPHIYGKKPASKYYYQKSICCRMHDYRCYGSEWRDIEGKTYKPGWYDEDNNRYDGIAKVSDEYVLGNCRYCDKTTQFFIDDHTHTQFECPNCGAPVNVVFVEEERTLKYIDLSENNSSARKYKEFNRYARTYEDDRREIKKAEKSAEDEVREVNNRIMLIGLGSILLFCIIYLLLDFIFDFDKMDQERIMEQRPYYTEQVHLG